MLEYRYMLHCLLLVLFAVMSPKVLCVMCPCRLMHAQKIDQVSALLLDNTSLLHCCTQGSTAMVACTFTFSGTMHIC